MQRIVSPSSFFCRLAAGVFLANLFVYLLAGLSLHQSRQQYKKQTELSTQNLANSLEVNIAGTIDKADVGLSAVANEAERQLAAGGIDGGALHKYASRQLALLPELNGIRITDAAGDIRYGTGIPAVKPVNIADRDYFLRLQETPDAGLVISPPIQSRITGTWIFTLARRLNRPDGSFAGIAYGVMPLEYFSKLFSILDIGAHGSITLRAMDLALIAIHPEIEGQGGQIGSTMVSAPTADRIRANSEAGSFTTISTRDNIERTISYHKIGRYPFFIFVGQATADYLAPWRQEAVVALSLLALFTMATGISAWLTCRTRKNERQAMREIEQHLATARQGAEELQTLNRRLAGIFNTMSDAFVAVDMNGNFSDFNQVYLEMLGYGADEIRALSERDITPTKWHPLEASIIEKEVMATGSSGIYEKEYRKKDGTIFPVELRTSLLRDADSTPTGMMAIVRDISRRKQTEAELELYRNNLEAMVQSTLASAIDISELRQAQNELILARDAANAANQAKSLFLANMSHEIRTPMNAVLGFAQLLERDASLPAAARDKVRIILKSGGHLLSIINDILEMSRIETGRVEVHPQPIDLHELLNDLDTMLRLRAEGKGLSFSLDRTDDCPRYILADMGKLRQILINLLGNAVKFTRQGAIVLRALPAANGRVTIEVQDTGIGIAPEEQGKLFHPFARIKGSEQTAGGTGLGLAISRQYAQLMGGELTVSSDVGTGSCFRFEFPAPLSTEAPKVIAAPQRVVGLAPGQGEVRVLVVDDQESNRMLLRALLEPLGFVVDEAGDGEEGVRKARLHPPCIILMDLIMPGMNGIETTRLLRSGATVDSLITIIAISASALEAERQAFLNAGGNAFITKPFQEQELYDILVAHAGVRFETEEPTATAPKASENTAIPTLQTMSTEWCSSFAAALARSNITRIRQLGEEVKAVDPVLAAWMLERAARYDLAGLKKLSWDR